LAAYAEKRDLGLLDVAAAGLAAQPAVGSVICGVTSGEQVRANAAASRWQPSAADLAELGVGTSRPGLPLGRGTGARASTARPLGELWT
jgi:aryl-alcohol dehydrogenase-like predicted oxidoreductase